MQIFTDKCVHNPVCMHVPPQALPNSVLYLATSSKF